MKKTVTLVAIFGIGLIGVQASAKSQVVTESQVTLDVQGSSKAETWYLYTAMKSGYDPTTRTTILEMDTKEGCEAAGNALQEDVKSNKMEHVQYISFTCIKRQ